MAFDLQYANLVAEQPQCHTRLIRDYDATTNRDFDIVIIGSGMGGGILADDLADRLGDTRRILVLDAGSFVYPTHVYNLSRIPNYRVARHFGVDNLKPWPEAGFFIGEKPQMAFGGRSIFWSGLIPHAQPWEMAFFPEAVRNELNAHYLALAGARMNESVSMGTFARSLVDHFKSSSLHDDFEITETPRALHQPYLHADGTPKEQFFVEPTGVFNTAELLINQVGLTSPETDLNGPGLFTKLNSFVEGVFDLPFGWHEVRITNTVTHEQQSFYAPKVVIAAGSTESPKLINRSSAYSKFHPSTRGKIGFGLTDHPVTGESQAYVSSYAGTPVTRNDHAKIVFYSRGNLDGNGHIDLPFNIEMNVNHEFWHLRENDPSTAVIPDDNKKARVDIKFSFANCLDDDNGIFSHAFDQYTPEVRFKRFSNLDDLLLNRFPATAGWHKTPQDFFNLLNATRNRVFEAFDGVEWLTDEYGYDKQWPFGRGTVHHACGTLRMPWKTNRDASFNNESVVDQNLEVNNTPGLYVCDMSVMPFSTAANPVRALAALALRLSNRLG